MRPTRRALAVLVGMAALVVAVDAITKYLATSRLADHQPVRVLGGVLYLDVIRNSGAAFSLGTGYTWVFPVFGVLVVGVIAGFARRLRSVGWAVALGLILGGALGNMADRLLRAPGFLSGHVVDFLSLFEPNGEHFAIFNLADAALCGGVALAVLLELLGRRRDGVPSVSSTRVAEAGSSGPPRAVEPARVTSDRPGDGGSA